MAKKFQKKNTSKGKSYFFEEILRVLKENPLKALNYKQIAGLLKVTDHSQKLLINALLDDFVSKGFVLQTERGKYKIKSMEKYILGKVDMTASGSAYVISDDLEEDVFIDQRKTGGAMNGDVVKVYLFPHRRGKQEGEIVEVIERKKTTFVGTIQLSERFAFLVPDNAKVGTDIYIPLDKLKDAENGQKAIARIIQWPKKNEKPIGEIIDVLGNAGDNDTEMHAILAEFGLPYSFPKDVEKVADLIPTNITKEEIEKRRDFRKITTFTIDPFDAKDFDDALSIEKLKNGNWEIGIHIADVAHYVKEGSVIDKEAFERATSVYLVDRTVPMLPEVLSNMVCSLRPNEEKLCFSAVFELDEEAQIINEWFGRTIINSQRRYTYEEAQEKLESAKEKLNAGKDLDWGKEGDYEGELNILDKLAKKLRKERFKKGSIGFEKLEVKFHLDESGNPTGVFFKQMKDSNQLIEDFMLLANRKVAEKVGNLNKRKTKTATQNNIPNAFVYRIHDRPDQDRLQSFSDFVNKFGYKINIQNGKAVADSINNLLKEVSEKPESSAIEMLAIRTMAKAVYSTDNIGHYGLGFDYYTHFTSPIRRYPDVMVHRLLEEYLTYGKVIHKKDELEEKCKHSSEMEKLAADAERASIKYKQVQFLQDKIGQQFVAVVTGVTEWGVFVEIEDNHCEGMVRLRDMKDDMYYFDEDNYRIVGKRTGKTYTLGDKVLIEVKRADLVKKQLDFAIIEDVAKAKDIPLKKQIERTELPKKEKIQTIKIIKEKKTEGKNFSEEWGFEI